MGRAPCGASALRASRTCGARSAYLFRTGKGLWVPYAMVYELAKFAGIIAGRQHERLPGTVVRALSHNTRGVAEK